ncbi:MAG: PEPxxWA-CTERM sorting domain-containing protein [Azoarcus sp.]|jgi:hypothetical protein|nr:PEPxxWA-CTERM sorting domain-containing protein [Azoarcus sp.]
MSKLFPVSVLALGAMCAVSANATTVQGGHLYIQDLSAPVQITFMSSRAAHDNYLYFGVIDAQGRLIGGEFEALFNVKGSPNDIGSLGSCLGCVTNGGTYSFTAPSNAVEVVFFWSDPLVGSYYSTAYKENRSDITGNKWDLITYNGGNTATVGFEDGGGEKKFSGWTTDWDWNDVVISVTNVGSTPSPVPEPETWAMLLAGLGMIGTVIRRRSKNQ